jgi:hypothetical protein
VEKSPGMTASMTNASNAVEKTLLPLLATHLPHLGMDELLFRHNMIMGGLAGLATGPAGIGSPKNSSNKKSREFLISWIIGSLKGPA